MNPKDRARWRLSDDDAGAIASIEAKVRSLGWSRQLFEKALDVYRDLPDEVRGDPEKLGLATANFLGDNGRGWTDFEAVSGWLADTATVGPPAAPAPSVEQDQQRLAEIRKATREGLDLDDWAERDHYNILARTTPQPDAPAQSAVRAASPTPNPDRLDQIRQLRRNDPDMYDRSREIQTEELALLTAQPTAPTDMGGTPAPVAAVAADAGAVT